MPTDEQAGAPSTPEVLDAAQDAALATNDFARYVEVENARDQNKAITEAPPPSKETTEKTPASEPGTAKEIQEKKAPGAAERIKELLDQRIVLDNENLRLKAELEKHKPGVKAAEPPPAVVPKVEAALPGAPQKPNIADFSTVGEFEDAKDKYVEDMIAFRVAEGEQKREAAAAQKTYNDAWVQKVAAAKEEFSDFETVAFNPKVNLGPNDGVVMKFLKTKAGANEARILYKLGENEGAEAKRILALDPFDQVEALVGIKQSLGSPKKEATTPPVKKHTAAPAPATSLGNNTEAVDDPVASLAANDFTNYMAKENARERKAAS